MSPFLLLPVRVRQLSCGCFQTHLLSWALGTTPGSTWSGPSLTPSLPMSCGFYLGNNPPPHPFHLSRGQLLQLSVGLHSAGSFPNTDLTLTHSCFKLFQIKSRSLPWPRPRSLPHLLLPPFLLSSSCHMALLVASWTVSSTGGTVYHPTPYSLHLAGSYFSEGT